MWSTSASTIHIHIPYSHTRKRRRDRIGKKKKKTQHINNSRSAKTEHNKTNTEKISKRSVEVEVEKGKKQNNKKKRNNKWNVTNYNSTGVLEKNWNFCIFLTLNFLIIFPQENIALLVFIFELKCIHLCDDEYHFNQLYYSNCVKKKFTTNSFKTI